MRRCNCCSNLFGKTEKQFKSPIKEYDYLCFTCLNTILISMNMEECSDDKYVERKGTDK